MNRYQLEVAEMDRRHRSVVRGLSFLGAATLVAAALWGAGVRPAEWWTQLRAWLSPRSTALPTTSQTPSNTEPASASAAAGAIAPSERSLAGTDSSISPTPRPLYLIATTPGRNKGEGTAQVGTSPENPQTYAGGAILANGARITEIHKEYIVLARDGEFIKLELYRRDKPQRLASSDLLQVGGREPQPIAPPLLRVAITTYMRPNPVFDGETLRGYEVYPGPKAGVFSQMGLQGGDVITALNNVPLIDADSAMQLFEQLTHGDAMMATVERKGTAQRISLDGSLIVADAERAKNAASARPPDGAGMPMPPG